MLPFVHDLLARHQGSNRPFRFVRLREAVAESTQAALLRGSSSTSTSSDSGSSDSDGGGTDTTRTVRKCPTCQGAGIKANTLCPRCEGSGLVPTGADPDGDGDAAVPNLATLTESQRPAQLVRLTPSHKSQPRRLREAANGESAVYEVELISEGFGNERDRVFYTKQALREAASSGVFDGMQAYANHPGKDEELNRPERDVRQLVGYYRGFKFKESGSEGKPVVAAELVVNQGDSSQWFVDLMESAIAAKGDGVRLCGISIDGGGVVELAEIDGKYANVCQKITEAASADIVTRPAAGGTIVRRLRESVARAQALPNPQETSAMKIGDVQKKLGTLHTRLRESVAKLTTEGASDEDVKGALTGLAESVQGIEELAATEIEAKVEFREAEGGDKAAAALATEKAELEVKLREAETKVTELTTKNTSLERTILAAQVLREAEVPAEQAREWFGDLVKLDGADAMKAHIKGRQDYEARLVERLRESVGFGGVEGVPARLPVAPPSTTGDPLADLGIPTLPTPEPAAAPAAA